MADLEAEIEDATIDTGKKEIDTIAGLFEDFLDTKKNGVNPERFMRAYSIVVKLCDQDDGSLELFQHYKFKMDSFIKKYVGPALVKKQSNSKEFL